MILVPRLDTTTEYSLVAFLYTYLFVLYMSSNYYVSRFVCLRNSMDNGFAYFTNVSIPRRNMAMRFAEVDENGKYRKKHVSDAASKISYITMMQVRAMIVIGSAKALSMACTINVRYSAVRKQGYAADGKSELQVLDYTQQQHRIFPLLAASYCFFFTGRKLWKNLKDIEHKLIARKPVTKVRYFTILFKFYWFLCTSDALLSSLFCRRKFRTFMLRLPL